jgi:hypothetical protein
MSALSSLETSLKQSLIQLEQQHADVRKLCILTDGYIVHSNVQKIDSTTINQPHIIHIGTKHTARSRQLADECNFHFEYLHDKIIDAFVQHFHAIF